MELTLLCESMVALVSLWNTPGWKDCKRKKHRSETYSDILKLKHK